MWPFKQTYDVFISHAVEDKIAIANELSVRLENAGLKVWYSGKELTVGDSIEKTIHKGLAQSRYGIVILTPTYLKKNWTMREFYTLLAREIENKKVILPILYDLTLDELIERDLTMMDRYALSFDKGIDHVVAHVIAVIKADKDTPKTRRRFFTTAALLVVMILAGVISWRFLSRDLSEDVIRNAVNLRIATLQETVGKEGEHVPSRITVTRDQPISVYADFQNLKAYYRNEYSFRNGYFTIRAKKNVASALNIDPDALGPFNNYMIPNASILQLDQGKEKKVRFVYVNSDPVKYEIVKKEKLDNQRYEVHIRYSSNIRLITTTFEYPNENEPKKFAMVIIGFLPLERYLLSMKNDVWTLEVPKSMYPE